MASDSDSQQSADMPLNSLSAGRVNIASQPLRSPKSPSAPGIEYPSGFAHPEFGEPGDFSKFNMDKSVADFRIPLSPSQIAKSQSIPQFGSPTMGSNNGKNDFEISKWVTPKIHARTHSDVQGMVARFNSLDIKDHADMRKKDAAALKRAQMGREEAEEEAKKLREEVRSTKKEIEEGKDRERRVVKRLDVVMEDLHRTKETQAHAQTLYEKEIRRARKEAFKSSSTLVKLQEELKVARKALGVVQSELDLERIKGGNKEQDAFAAQYQLIGVQEELVQAQSRIKVVEEERDALKMTLRKEEVTKIASEGKIALPTSTAIDDEFGSPKKQPPQAPQSPSKDRSQNRYEVERLTDELEMERKRSLLAECEVDFLKLECQFGCCACQKSQSQSEAFVYDASFEAEIQKFHDAIANIFTRPESIGTEEDKVTAAISIGENLPPNATVAAIQIDNDHCSKIATPSQTEIEAVPKDMEECRRSPTGLDGVHETQLQGHSGGEDTPVDESYSHRANLFDAMEIETSTHADSSTLSKSKPETTEPPVEEQMPYQYEPRVEQQAIQSLLEQEDESEKENMQTEQPYREITTTRKIPLVDESTTPDYSAFCTPMKLTREEAIEQLRQRRGRARSVAGTPKKPLQENREPRRDISAPETRIGHTPGQGVKKS